MTCTADGAFVPPPNDSEVCGIMNPADAIACYKEKISAGIKRVRAMSGEQLCGQIDFLGMFQMPGIAYLSLMIKHSVHHRGQLSVYLRLKDVPLPPIYGPTADEQ